MNYELAKELKEAGFPTKHYVGSRFYLNESPNLVVSEAPMGGEYHFRDNETYIPTLSELIEACAERFVGLINRHDWLAISDDGHENGSTPEEAVARLWLALHAKV